MTQDVTISALVPFVVYPKVAGMEKLVPAGHRLVSVSWKQSDEKTKKGIKVRTPCAVAIPTIPVTVNPECLQAALADCLADIQDKMVADTVNAAIERDSAIQWSAIKIEADNYTVDGIAAWCLAQAEKGRLTKEAIGNWFDSLLKDTLESRLAELPGIDDATLAVAMKHHRDNLQALANPKGKMPEKLVKQLINAIGLVESDDKIKSGMVARLNSYLQPVAEAMEFALA